MTTSLAPRTGLIGVPSTHGLALPPDLTFEEWRGALETADMLVAAGPWFLVDLMAYGAARFAEAHSQALPTAEEDPHGVRQSRLKQAAWMAEKYPRNQRVPGLSYTHHRAVAELEPLERQALLREAAEQQLSTRQLIERVRDRQAAISAESRAVDGPACAAEAGLREPTEDDLTDDARAALRFKADTLQVRDRGSFAAGWVAALHWAEVGDVFEGGADA